MENFSLTSLTPKNCFPDQTHLTKLFKSRKLTKLSFHIALNVIRELTPKLYLILSENPNETVVTAVRDFNPNST